MYSKTIFFIVVYLIATIGFFILIKKASLYFEKKQNPLLKSKKIKIEERIFLGQNREILIIVVENKRYLIGASLNNISLLKELEENHEKNTEIT